MVAEMRLTRLRAVAWSRMSEIPSAARFSTIMGSRSWHEHQEIPKSSVELTVATTKSVTNLSQVTRPKTHIISLYTFEMPGQLILKVTTELKTQHVFWSPLVDMSIVAVLWKFCGETFLQNRLKQELNAAGASVPSEKRRPFQSALHFHSKQSLTRSWPNPQRFKKWKVVTDVCAILRFKDIVSLQFFASRQKHARIYMYTHTYIYIYSYTVYINKYTPKNLGNGRTSRFLNLPLLKETVLWKCQDPKTNNDIYSSRSSWNMSNEFEISWPKNFPAHTSKTASGHWIKLRFAHLGQQPECLRPLCTPLTRL